MLYILIYIIGLILCKLEEKWQRSLIFYTLLLIALASLRYGIGADYFGYKVLYQNIRVPVINELKFSSNYQEILFRIISSFMKTIKIPYQVYIAFFSTINLIYIAKTCEKYSSRPMMSLLFYYSFFFFVWTCSGIRQGMTLVIGMYYFLQYIENGKKLRFVIITIILSLIHLSALILLLFMLIRECNFTRKSLIIISICSILISMLPINKIIMLFIDMPIVKRIEPYLSGNYGISNILSFPSIVRMLFLIAAFYYYNGYSNKDRISKVIADTFILSMNLYFVLKFSEITAARLSIYGYYLIIIILPDIYNMYKTKLGKVLVASMLLIFSSMYIAKEIHTMKNQTGLIHPNKVFIPYTNIFNINDYDFNNRYLKFIQ